MGLFCETLDRLVRTYLEVAVVATKVSHFLKVPINTRNAVLGKGHPVHVESATISDRIAKPLSVSVGADVKFVGGVVTNTPEFYTFDNMGLSPNSLFSTFCQNPTIFLRWKSVIF